MYFGFVSAGVVALHDRAGARGAAQAAVGWRFDSTLGALGASFGPRDRGGIGVFVADSAGTWTLSHNAVASRLALAVFAAALVGAFFATRGLGLFVGLGAAPAATPTQPVAAARAGAGESLGASSAPRVSGSAVGIGAAPAANPTPPASVACGNAALTRTPPDNLFAEGFVDWASG